MEKPDADQEEILQVRDGRGENRTHIDNTLIKDFGWLIGANAIAVYAVILMHADVRNQKAYPSIETIAQMTGLSKPTVIQCIKLLEFLKMIRKIRVGKTCTNRYVMLDKVNWRRDWEKIAKELQSEVSPFNVSGKAILLQRLNSFTSIVTRPNSNKTQVTRAEASPPQEFDLKSELEKWSRDDAPRRMQILAYFIERKGLAPRSKGELDAIRNRHIRDAKALEPFETRKITDVMDKCDRDERAGKYKWALSSVLKELTK